MTRLMTIAALTFAVVPGCKSPPTDAEGIVVLPSTPDRPSITAPASAPAPRERKPITIPYKPEATPLIFQVLVTNEEVLETGFARWTPVQKRVTVVTEGVAPEETRVQDLAQSAVLSILPAAASAGITYNTAIKMDAKGVSAPLQHYPNTANAIRVSGDLLKGLDPGGTVMKVATTESGQTGEMIPVATNKAGDVLYSNMGREIPKGNAMASIVDVASGKTIHSTSLAVGAFALKSASVLPSGGKTDVFVVWSGGPWPFKPDDAFEVTLTTDGRSLVIDGSPDPGRLRQMMKGIQLAQQRLATLTAIIEGQVKIEAQIIQSIGR